MRRMSIYRLSLRFVVAAFVLLTLSRLALCWWLADRVTAVQGWDDVLLGGLRVDAVLLAIALLPPMLLAPWLGHRPIVVGLVGWWYRLAFVLLAVLEIATPTFIGEYDTRPNRLFFEYLGSPREVGGMLLSAYPLRMLVAAMLLVAVIAGARAGFPVKIGQQTPLRAR